MKIFLGGTCANTKWRDELIPYLEKNKIEYFNPVVKNWTEECQAIEEEEKNRKCNVHLYVITKEMKGTYSIAEIIHSAHLANMYGTSVDRIIFAVLNVDNDWEKHEINSFNAIMNMVKNIAPYSSNSLYIKNMNDLFQIIIN